MSKARLVITAVTVEKRSVSEVARTYGVARSWIYKLLARYEAEGEAAFEPRSRRPKTSPATISEDTVELIIRLRKELSGQGLDAGPHTIAWHLEHHHQITVSAATISRYLTRQGLVTPEPRKRPRSSYLRFAAELPNERWQSDFIHHHLADGTETEIVSWIDDHSRYALSVTAHPVTTGQVTLATFRAACARYGIPASTLTDNGLVYTTRLAGGRGGRNGLEHELRALGVTQKNGRLTPDPGQGRTIPADPAKMAGRPPGCRHAHRPASPARRLHRGLQHPAAAPVAGAPGHPGGRLRRPAQGRTRRPRRRYPRPGPGRHHRRHRHRHPPPRRAAPPHRRRPDPRPNPRPAPDPRPGHPHHQRRHRRTPAPAHPRPRPQLPAHPPPARTHENNTPQTEKPRTLTWVSRSFLCPERSQSALLSALLRIRTCALVPVASRSPEISWTRNSAVDMPSGTAPLASELRPHPGSPFEVTDLGSVGRLCARQTRSTTQPERGCAHPLNRAGAESRTSDIPAAVCRSIHDLPAGRTACRLTAIAGPPGR